MYWDFRIIKYKVHGIDSYRIHRIFYSDSSKRNAMLIEHQPASIIGVEPKSMLEDIEIMTNAFDYPTLYLPKWNIS